MSEFIGSLLDRAAASKQMKYTKAVGEYNAQVYEQNSKNILTAMYDTVGATRRQHKAFEGAQVANIAASGIRLSGSAAEVLEASMLEMGRDVRNIKLDGLTRATAERNRAAMSRYNAMMEARFIKDTANRNLIKGGVSDAITYFAPSGDGDGGGGA